MSPTRFTRPVVGVQIVAIIITAAAAAAASNLNAKPLTCHAPERRLLTDDVRTTLPSNGSSALLLSFPGSGNTWVRALIEIGTGFHSTSVYRDTSLVPTFPAEDICNDSSIVVKSHSVSGVQSEHPLGMFPNNPSGFKLGPVKRLVVILRHPIDAMFAEYWRQATHNHAGHGIDKDGVFVFSKFEQTMDTLASNYVKFMSNLNQILLNPETALKDLHIVRFEDLTAQGLKHTTLASLLDFLLGSDPALKRPWPDFSPEVTSCVFHLADQPQIHRKKTEDSISSEHLLTHRLVCHLWESVGEHAESFGYKPPFGLTC